jgi:hypothetical protein
MMEENTIDKLEGLKYDKPTPTTEALKIFDGREALGLTADFHSNPCPMKEVAEGLYAFAEEFLSTYEPPHVGVSLKKPDHKYKALSNLQKSIRRGLLDEAFRSVSAMLSGKDSENHLVRRLPVIAMEDIGIANPYLVSLTILLLSRVRLRNKYGTERLVYWLTEQLCKSRKSRLLCDIEYAISHSPLWQPHRKMVGEFTTRQRLSWVFDPEPNVFDRSLALWAIQGTDRWEIPDMPTIAHDKDLVIKMMIELGMPPIISFMRYRYSLSYFDGMFIPIPAVWELLAETTQVSEVVTEFPPVEQRIRGAMPCAYDVHVQDGIKAMAYFSKSCDAIREFFVRNPGLDKIKALGMAVFIAESGLLDRKLTFDFEPEISESCKEYEISAAGLEVETGLELIELVRIHRAELDYARKKVVI